MTTLVAPAPARSAPPRVGGWVRSPVWDGTWMLSALWLAPLVYLLGRGHASLATSPVDSLYFVLSLGFWVGHRVSSTWLAYFTTAYRPLLVTQRTRFVWVPIGLALFCFAVFLPPDDALPFTRFERFVFLAIVDYFLVTYHFAAQHYGALSLYRLRAGQVRDPGARRVDRLFALGVGGVLVIAAEVLAGSVFFQERWLDPILDPALVDRAQQGLRIAGTALVALAAAFLLVRDARRAHFSWPRALYVLGVAMMVLAAFHIRDPFAFVVLWTAQHWMVAVGLATLVARGEEAPGPSRWYRFWHVVNRRAWVLLLVLMVLSAALLPFMEVEALGEDAAASDATGPIQVLSFDGEDVVASPAQGTVGGGSYYADRFLGRFAVWLRTSWLVPALVALGLATAFVHYALDRAVYRFSDPEVRRAAKGLLDPPA